jgi:arsenate reductase
MERKEKLLFLSRGTSSRSHMAEGFLHALAADRFITTSAGIVPGGISPMAIEVMKEVGIDISCQESKSVADVLREHFGYVITICDMAKERSPIFPFTFNLLHWSVADPATLYGSYAETRAVFRCARDDIRIKVCCFLGETAEKQEQEHAAHAYA